MITAPQICIQRVYTVCDCGRITLTHFTVHRSAVPTFLQEDLERLTDFISPKTLENRR